MRVFKRIVALFLGVLALASCEIRPSTPPATEAPVVSAEIPVPESSEETTANTEETTTFTTSPHPDVPDTSVFSNLEMMLQCPPVDGAKVSFAYEDLTTGISYSYNGDTLMWSASLMKLPIVMSVLYRAETEDMGLDNIYVYDPKDFAEGTGEIFKKPVGSEFTYIELVDYMLMYSDNIALEQFRRTYGRFDHYDYVRGLGADSFTLNSGWRSTSKDCVKVLRSTYEYLEGDHLYSDRIKKDMINSMHQVMLSPGLSGKPIARKYGWDTEGYNDMGIVYDEHPYAIVFMSDMVMGEGVVNGYISSLAAETDRIHTELWSTVEETTAYTIP